MTAELEFLPLGKYDRFLPREICLRQCLEALYDVEAAQAWLLVRARAVET